jgi:hypothetical protein
MNPFRAVLRGAAQVGRAWPVALLIWALTLAFAVVLVLPVAAVLHFNLGHSLYAARLFDNFDPQWIAEFLLQTGRWPIAAIAPLAAAFAAAFLLLMTFVSGGALAVFSGDAQTPGRFWPGCARNFPRLLLLLLLSLVCYGLVLSANAPLEGLGRKIWGAGMEERPLILFSWARAAVLLLLMVGVNLVFDYAKIRAVADDVRNPFGAAVGAFVFVARHPIRTVGTYALVGLLAVALAALYRGVSSVLPRTSFVSLVGVLVVQQAFVAARVLVRLLFFAGQTEMHLALKPAPEPVPQIDATEPQIDATEPRINPTEPQGDPNEPQI